MVNNNETPSAKRPATPRYHLKLTSDSLAPHLAQQLRPAYLVSGDEPLLAAEAADAVRARARAAGFSERDVHFIERAADWEDVRGSTANLSLFGARRLVEIRLASGKPGVAGNAALVALLERADPDTLFLILAPRLDRDAQGAQWVSAVDAKGAWVQIWPVDAARLAGWLKARAGRLGLNMNEEALELLAERTEGNLLAAHQELAKLALLAAGSPVSAEAVLAGETPRALRMLAGLRAEGTEPTLALWALTKAVRDIWNSQAGGAARAPSWQRQAAALAQAQRRAPRLSFSGLVRRAARADRMIKGRLGGNAWDEMALLAADLCAQPTFPLPSAAH